MEIYKVDGRKILIIGDNDTADSKLRGPAFDFDIVVASPLQISKFWDVMRAGMHGQDDRTIHFIMGTKLYGSELPHSMTTTLHYLEDKKEFPFRSN